MNSLYLVEPEVELNYGYSDFLMLPDKARYADIAHSYIMELKYVQPTASDAEVEGKSREAEEQLKKYGADRGGKAFVPHPVASAESGVPGGAEMTVCEELGQSK